MVTCSVLKKVAVGLALLGFTSLASAGPITHDLGVLDKDVLSSGDISLDGSFDDIFKFTASNSMSSILGTVVGVDIIGDLTAQYRFGVGSAPVWGGYSSLLPVPSDPDTGEFSYKASFGGLASGQTYWFELAGTATNAFYSVKVAPVPEPETYAMFLAGMGLMGAIVRRRNRGSRG